MQSAGARGLSQCQWIFLILFCLPFLLLCSKGGLCWENRAQSENKSIYTFQKCQVKIYNSVYHSRVAFPRQHKCNILFCTLNTIQKHGLCWKKSTGGLCFFIRMTNKRSWKDWVSKLFIYAVLGAILRWIFPLRKNWWKYRQRQWVCKSLCMLFNRTFWRWIPLLSRNSSGYWCLRLTMSLLHQKLNGSIGLARKGNWGILLGKQREDLRWRKDKK